MLRMMGMVFWLGFVFIAKCQVQPYSEMGNTSSSVYTLYNSSTTSLPQGLPASPFTIPYPTPKQTNPKLVIGLIGYEERDDASDSYLKVSLASSNLLGITLNVVTAGSSLVYIVQVMYLAIQDTSNGFYCLWVEYPSFSTVNSGTGSRTENKYSSFYTLTGGSTLNSNTALNRVYVFITGFEVQALTGNLGIQMSAAITNAISFTTTIKASYDCRIQYIQGMFLFIDTSKFSAPTLFIYDTTVVVDSAAGLTASLLHYGSYGHVVLGFFHLKASGMRNAGAVIKFALSLSSPNVTIQVNSKIQILQYTYLFFGLNRCPTPNPYYTSSTRSACVAQCPTGQTQSPSTGTCSPCLSPCSKCLSSSILCTECITGYELDTGTGLCTLTVQIVKQESKLYLLGLLGIIPIALLVVYLCLRKPKRKLNRKQMMAQPNIDFS